MSLELLVGIVAIDHANQNIRKRKAEKKAKKKAEREKIRQAHIDARKKKAAEKAAKKAAKQQRKRYLPNGPLKERNQIESQFLKEEPKWKENHSKR